MNDSRLLQAEAGLDEAQTILTDLLDDEPSIAARQQLRVVLSLLRDAIYNTRKLHHTADQSELPL